MKLYSTRAGFLRKMPTNYECFVPTSLNEVVINIDKEMAELLSSANNLLGKVDAIASALPDKDLFLSMYVEKEAVLSAQIEGTQVSLTDVLQQNTNGKRKDTEEIVNYVRSLNYGIKLLDKLPLSIRFMKEIHKELLSGVRGEEKTPGELRRSQNWIGPHGCTLDNASYIPPSVDLMHECLNNLELYLHKELDLPALIQIALIHYQFETIHPFLDGNGRLGRLLILLWLKSNNYLNYPILYLSLYFKQNRNEYYSLLMDVRFKGKYEEWIKFFLKGFIETSINVIETINKISLLKDNVNNSIKKLKYRNKDILYKTLEYIYKHPFITTNDLLNEFNITRPTAVKTLEVLEYINIIKLVENKKRYRVYKFEDYIDILEKGTEL